MRQQQVLAIQIKKLLILRNNDYIMNINIIYMEGTSMINTLPNEHTGKNTNVVNKGHKGQKGKKVQKKKADLIREQQNSIRQKKLVEDDFNRIKFMENSIDLEKPFKNFNNLKTIEENVIKYVTAKEN